MTKLTKTEALQLPLAERLALFLEVLGRTGHVDEGLRATGLSMNAVTHRRRKDPDFAAGWELALDTAGARRAHLLFLDVYSKTGNMTEACRLSGLRRADVLAKKKDDPEGFGAAMREAEAEAADVLEAEARRRAVEGTDDLVIHSGAPVYHRDAKGKVVCDELGQPIPVVKKIYSDRLLETLLKANNPDKFRENVKVDHAVTGGVLLIGQKGPPPTEEEWEQRMQQRRLKASNQAKVIEHDAIEQ